MDGVMKSENNGFLIYRWLLLDMFYSLFALDVIILINLYYFENTLHI